MPRPKASANIGSISQAEFDEAMAKTYVPLEMRGKMSGFFGTTQKYGVWGSIGRRGRNGRFRLQAVQRRLGRRQHRARALGRGARHHRLPVGQPPMATKAAAGSIDLLPHDARRRRQRAAGLEGPGPGPHPARGLGHTSFLPNGLSYCELWTSV